MAVTYDFDNGSKITTFDYIENHRSSKSKQITFFCDECKDVHKNYDVVNLVVIGEDIMICKESFNILMGLKDNIKVYRKGYDAGFTKASVENDYDNFIKMLNRQNYEDKELGYKKHKILRTEEDIKVFVNDCGFVFKKETGEFQFLFNYKE